jgi:hypothetical protein
MLNLDLASLNKKKVKVTDIIPDWCDHLYDFLSKGGAEIEITYQNV